MLGTVCDEATVRLHARRSTDVLFDEDTPGKELPVIVVGIRSELRPVQFAVAEGTADDVAATSVIKPGVGQRRPVARHFRRASWFDEGRQTIRYARHVRYKLTGLVTGNGGRPGALERVDVCASAWRCAVRINSYKHVRASAWRCAVRINSYSVRGFPFFVSSMNA